MVAPCNVLVPCRVGVWLRFGLDALVYRASLRFRPALGGLGSTARVARSDMSIPQAFITTILLDVNSGIRDRRLM